jgi:hypothetical protein
MGIVNGILYTVSGVAILLETFGFVNLGLTALLSPAVLAMLSGLGIAVYNRKKK